MSRTVTTNRTFRIVQTEGNRQDACNMALHDFMQLPKEERRKILESQAEKAIPLYAPDKDRDEWQAGDFIEYE